MLSRRILFLVCCSFILLKVNAQKTSFAADSAMVAPGWDAYNKYDAKMALAIFKREAEKGNPVAENIMGLTYLRAELIEKDCSLAESWLIKSAEHNFPDAMYNLGIYYLKDSRIGNDSSAFKWSYKAALLGHPLAENTVGVAYMFSMGVQQNDSLAFSWLLKSVNHGCLEAVATMRELCQRKELTKKVGRMQTWAKCFLSGEAGCIKNEELGFKLIQQDAIFTNDPESYYLIAQCHEKGIGTKLEIEKATDMYRLAFMLGKAEAENDMNRLMNK